MKKIIMLFIAMAMTFAVAEAAESSKKVKPTIEEQTFIADIDCEKCVAKIMNYMPFQKGVKDVEVDLKTKSVEMRFDSRKTSVPTITKLFEKIDVKVEVLKDEPQKK